MERISEKPNGRAPYIALALMLSFAVLGTVLFLGHGMDTANFFVAINTESCAFVLSLSFPVFIGIEFIGTLMNEGGDFSLWPWDYPARQKDIKISSAFAFIGLAIGIFGYLAYQNVNPPLCIALVSQSSFLGAFIYYGLIAYRGNKKEGLLSKAFLLPVFYAVILIAIESATLALIYQKSTDFAMLMIGFPLLFLSSALAFRKD